MPEEILALVRRVYESWNEHGVKSIEPFLADDVEARDAPEMPDARNWRGREAVLTRLEEVATSVGGGWADLRGFERHGHKVLVSMVWQENQRKDSPAFAEIFHVVEVSDGRIQSLSVFLDHPAAEAAAAE